MAVQVRFFDVTLTYTRAGWRGNNPVIVALLNASARRVAMGYLPERADAEASLRDALGNQGWTITSADPEPSEPRRVY